VFVAPGGDRAIADAVRARDLPMVEARTTLGACVMASVTGELGEAPGVAVTPFCAGVLGGAACAARRRAPVLLLTEHHADASTLAPHVKATLDVSPESAGHWIAHASRLAMTEPRGPVHLTLARGVAGAAALPVAASCRPDPTPAPVTLDAAAAAIRAAARPVVVAGRGCRADAAPWLRAFAESLPAPVLVTSQGKGVLADPHPLALGMLARDHPLLARADLIFALGADGDEVGPGAWPDGARLFEVVGDPALVLAELAERLRGDRRADWDVAELDRIKRGLLAAPAPLRQIVSIVRDATPVGTRATADLPIASLWQAVLPGDYLADPDTPGFAIAAAIAASLIDPARRAVAFTDAHGLAAVEAELATAEALGATVVVVVMGEDGVSSPDELRRAFDSGWRSARVSVVRARVAGPGLYRATIAGSNRSTT